MVENLRLFMGTDGKKRADFPELLVLYKELEPFGFVPYINFVPAIEDLKRLVGGKFRLDITGGYTGLCVAEVTCAALEMGGQVVVDLPHCRNNANDTGFNFFRLIARKKKILYAVNLWHIPKEKLQFKGI